MIYKFDYLLLKFAFECSKAIIRENLENILLNCLYKFYFIAMILILIYPEFCRESEFIQLFTSGGVY